MKNILIYLILLVFIASCTTPLTKEQSNQLKKAYSEKNFFKLDKLMSGIKLDKHNPDLLLYKATLDYAFNKPEASNELISFLLKDYKEYFNDSIKKELFSMLSANYYRQQDYEEANSADSVILADYKQLCDSSEVENRKNDISIFRSLKSIPKMEINIPGNGRIALKRDLAGLQNVGVSTSSDSMDFVFDTGAAFSVIMESVAKKWGVKVLPDKVYCGTATSIVVPGKMGLLDIQLGKLQLKNVAFIVMPDSALTFGNGIYKIHGIIGFPVMYALKRFSLTEKELIFNSKKGKENSSKNFALDGQYLILHVITGQDSFPFMFDSGSQTSYLSSLYFNTYKTKLTSTYQREKVMTGGAGGMEETEAYIMDSIQLRVEDAISTIDSIRVYPNDGSNYEMKFLYGNVGQDFVGKFSEMTIDFNTMQVSFEGKKK